MEYRLGRVVRYGLWILAVSLVVTAAALWIVKHQETEKLYQEIREAILGFPGLKEPYQTAVCDYRDGANEYLLVETTDLQIAGVRDGAGYTAYFLNGQRVVPEPESSESETDLRAEEIREITAKGVGDLLTDSGISYAYKVPRVRDLPLWIYPDDSYYFRITRPGYEDCMEVMTSGERSRGQYVQWNIAESSEAVLLYLLIKESANIDDLDMVRGWGRLPEALLAPDGQ